MIFVILGILTLVGLVVFALANYIISKKPSLERTFCIFCNNHLDNSDEHIIPDSLNGRLHSTKIICSACNNQFGRFIDPVFKEQLNPMLLAFGFKNASNMHAEGLEGEKYQYDKAGLVSPVRDEVQFIKGDHHTLIRVQGGRKSAIKALKRQAVKLEKKGYKLKGLSKAEIISEHNLLKIKFDLKLSPKLVLGLNKIAVEYYALCGLDTRLIRLLLDKIKDLNEEIDNTILCNWNCNIRDYDLEEISHLIALRTNKKGTLYCYIELFNTVCACVTICENYPKKVNKTYYQDAITGEKLDKLVKFSFEPLDEPKNNDENFEVLINATFERLSNSEFNKILTSETEKILVQFKTEQSQNITHEKYELENRLGKMVAELSMAFPYMIEDYKDELNDEVNHINSNLIEEQFEEFCTKNAGWVGKHIKIGEELYKFDSIIKSPFLKRNGTSLIKVHFKLVSQVSNKPRFYPYAEFFRMVNQSYPDAAEKASDS